MARESNGQLSSTYNFNEGIRRINETLNCGSPITVGVSHTLGRADNNDLTTNHYVVIMGRGLDSEGIYYRFFEVGTRHHNKGVSLENKLRINGNFLSGSPAYNPSRIYTVSQVRPTY